MAYVQLVTGSGGTAQRAEPVAGLYERGKVRHMGQFAELEQQYCQFSTVGYQGAGSPNHVNAAIWALTDLMIDREPQPNIRVPEVGYPVNPAGFRRRQAHIEWKSESVWLNPNPWSSGSDDRASIGSGDAPSGVSRPLAKFLRQ